MGIFDKTTLLRSRVLGNQHARFWRQMGVGDNSHLANDNAARELLLAGIAHLKATLPDPTLSHLNALLCHQAPDSVIDALERSPAPTARMKALAFLGALRRNDRLLGSVFSEITPRFMVLADPRVQATTSRNEVDFRRLAAPGRQAGGAVPRARPHPAGGAQAAGGGLLPRPVPHALAGGR